MNKTLINEAHEEGLKAQSFIKNKNAVAVMLLDAVKNNDPQSFSSVIMKQCVMNNVSIPTILLNMNNDNLFEIGHSFVMGLLGER